MDEVLISALADGEFHSGQELAELLGLSRMAIWKQLRKLEGHGLTVESVRGRGYRIPGGIELLDGAAIRAGLSPAVLADITKLEVFDVMDSTNAYVASLGDKGCGVVCLAERQTQGRGRRGRQWQSPFGRNLYLSLGWTFTGGATALEGLSLAVGVAVRRALSANGQPLLKWPNDLLYNGRKLAGILIEMSGDPTGDCQVVIGVGVNIGMRGEARPEIDQPWADAREFTDDSRNVLAARIINEVFLTTARFAERGFASFQEEWCQYDAWAGKPVYLTTPAARIEGIARGVTENGALRLEVNGEIQLVTGGEISLRLQ